MVNQIPEGRNPDGFNKFMRANGIPDLNAAAQALASPYVF